MSTAEICEWSAKKMTRNSKVIWEEAASPECCVGIRMIVIYDCYMRIDKVSASAFALQSKGG